MQAGRQADICTSYRQYHFTTIFSISLNADAAHDTLGIDGRGQECKSGRRFDAE